MARRNPNGYGCVTKLKGNRSRPWVVKVTIYDHEGNAHQQNVGYAADESEARQMLAQYNNNPWDAALIGITFNDLYKKWLEVKAPYLGASNVKRMKAGFKHCSSCYGMKYKNIKSFHMQKCIDDCPLSRETKAAIMNLFYHLDRFAFELDLIDKMYSQLVKLNAPVVETKRQPFTADEIKALWDMSNDKMVQVVLIYLYTGFRLKELMLLPSCQVDLKEMVIQGGEKTAAGKNRLVPIHPRIEPFIREMVSNEYLITNPDTGTAYKENVFYNQWNEVMKRIKATHTPHECRHTFETLLDNAGGNRKCIDMLMGHKSLDVGNRVYNHKTLEQLRETILLLK